MDNKRVIIIGGGTFSHVRSHLSLAVPAFGETARRLSLIVPNVMPELDYEVYTTKMACDQHFLSVRNGNAFDIESFDSPGLVTNEDVEKLVDQIIADDKTKVIFFNAGIVDYNGRIEGSLSESGKYAKRLKTRENPTPVMLLSPAEKIIRKIRKERKDIFLVAFKATSGKSEDEQYIEALNLCKEASANLVLANDNVTRRNMIVTPEEARYCVTTDRDKALQELVEMAKARSHLTFTRSTVISGDPVPWDDDRVPQSLREVVDFCIQAGAYKPFRGSTVGHFACKIDDQTFLTSKRKTNFNDLQSNGLVLVKTDGPDTVLAYGAKPSVGGQSQRIVFGDHEGMDCIVHFHCPLKDDPRDNVPQASQREFECGSHECGQNTSNHLGMFGNLKAVYLQEHGPNIVFSRSIDPAEVIDFIQANFDLDQKTGGFVSIQSRIETPNTLEDAQRIL